jgi:hypothetical protein
MDRRGSHAAIGLAREINVDVMGSLLAYMVEGRWHWRVLRAVLLMGSGVARAGRMPGATGGARRAAVSGETPDATGWEGR